MTRADAKVAARKAVRREKVAYDVWEHTGSPGVPAQGRFVHRSSLLPPPKHNRWTKVETVDPPKPRVKKKAVAKKAPRKVAKKAKKVVKKKAKKKTAKKKTTR